MSLAKKKVNRIEESLDFKIFKNQKNPKINEQWKDDIFPPNDNSLLGRNSRGEYIDSNEGKYKMIHNDEIEWKRISEIIPKPVIYEDIMNINNIRFGRLSYIYFYSVLSALSQFPSLFNKIILTKEYNPNGLYKLLLFIDGEFQIIYIDDFFPCIKNSNVLYFIKPSNFEIWSILIEKAWAKVNGGYQNIINSWPVDLFRALTGASCEEFIHDELTSDELFNELNYSDKNYGFCISLSNNRDVVKKGLLNYHMYILIETEKVDMGKNLYLYLCKFRDPTGESNWIGNWNEKSELWNEKIRKKINKSKLNLKKGEFWICIEDVKKYFIRSDICHMIYDGFSKTFEFKDKEIMTPKIFNFYLQEEGMVSISIYEKNWQFHRELRYISHPTSLIIAEYDIKNNSIKNIISKYESNNAVEITKNLQKGYYLVWAYKTNDIDEKIICDEMKIRFCSDSKLSIKFKGNDDNFHLIKNIIYQHIKEKNKNKIKSDEVFYETENSFLKSGLGYKLCINPLDNVYQEWIVDSSKIEGYILLSPYNKKNFDLTIGYKGYKIILGIKKQKFDEHWFNLNVEVIQNENSTKKELTNFEKNPDINSFFSKDNKYFLIINENPTFSYEEMKKKPKFPSFDHWQLFLEKYKKKYPFIINELQKLKPLDNEKLDLIEIEKDNNIYIGEADYIIRNGRGGMIFKDEGRYYVGYWDNGRQFKKGKVFDRKNNLLYDGEYKNGVKEGIGVYYYQSGEKYEGKFVNGVKEGKGIFYWKNGNKWEGYFKNDKMNGEGIFYDGEESFSAIYKNGELMD